MSRPIALLLILPQLIRSLSTTASSRPLLKKKRVRDALLQIKRADEVSTASATEIDLEWLAVAKAAIQVYGIVLNTLLDQTIPLSESIWYWDGILGSYAYTALYTVQSSPARIWQSSRTIYADAKSRYLTNMSVRDAAEQSAQSLSEGWKEFYGLVQQSIQDRSLARNKILSPFAVCRTEARRKQDGSKKLRARGATAIGLLMEKGIQFKEAEPNHSSAAPWKVSVTSSIILLESLFKHMPDLKIGSSNFVTTVTQNLASSESLSQSSDNADPQQQVSKLLHVLDVHMPEEEQMMRNLVQSYGKPSRLTRYWVPGLVLFASSGALLRIFANRQQEIVQWVSELGETTIDFWYNWVVEPTKRLIGTIRHDENSELAIMSKDSLKSDRDSLERMVVDFAMEYPENGTAYTNAQIADIRTKVREGDLSAVLKAYEKEIQSPAKGAIFGNLIRTLLIQVQKTKVDVEVAMSGIDEILKSQELLFGMVGIAPGIVISWLVFSWFRSTFGNRRGLKEIQQKGDSVRLLRYGAHVECRPHANRSRNIDRTLSNATLGEEDGRLSYQDYGLLLCEVHLLRARATRLVPGAVQREFVEDLNDLLDVHQGRDRQLKVVERIQWAYGKWLK